MLGGMRAVALTLVQAMHQLILMVIRMMPILMNYVTMGRRGRSNQMQIKSKHDVDACETFAADIRNVNIILDS
jgi:Na+(H+)/acetate symporter ActP